MLAAKNYQAALFILRQLEFGLFDFRLHAEFNPQQGAKILETLFEIKKQVAVVPSPTWGRFPHAFSHIFAGGYAAGSEEPMELFKRFRGREPQLDAMLEHYGIKG